jgi:MYXO-CTERM domain-containing protein
VNTLRRSVRLVALASACAVPASALAQNVFDDFSSGNDNAWTRVDAPGIFLGIPSTYSVENGGYRLRGPVFPNVGQNLPTASLRVDGAAADSQISVDVTDWDETLTQSASIAARVQQPSPSQFQFYSLTLFMRSNAGPGLSNFRIDRWNADGSVVNLTANLFFPQVDPDHDIRLVFTVEGSSLRGDLFNLTLDPLNPLQTISVIDSGPLAISGVGLPGIMTTPNPPNINAPTFGPADVTFDNFRVVPTPGAIPLLALAGVGLSRRRRS